MVQIFYIIISILFIACSGRKNILNSDKTTYHDSIYVEIVKVDTFKIPQEITHIEYQPITLHDTIIVEKNSRSKAVLRVKDKKITCEAYCDSVQKAYLSSIITTQNRHQVSNSIRVQKDAIKPRNKFWEGFAVGVISVSAFLIGYKIAKTKI